MKNMIMCQILIDGDGLARKFGKSPKRKIWNGSQGVGISNVWETPVGTL